MVKDMAVCFSSWDRVPLELMYQAFETSPCLRTSLPAPQSTSHETIDVAGRPESVHLPTRQVRIGWPHLGWPTVTRISAIDTPQKLCAQSDERFDADGVENLLQSGDRHGLVFRLFVPADDLFADAEPARKFSWDTPLAIRIFVTKGAI